MSQHLKSLAGLPEAEVLTLGRAYLDAGFWQEVCLLVMWISSWGCLCILTTWQQTFPRMSDPRSHSDFYDPDFYDPIHTPSFLQHPIEFAGKPYSTGKGTVPKHKH